MNIYVQIEQQMNELSANEKKIAEYILAHPSEAASLTANKLTKDQYVSKSAVYRFCSKLRLSGFSELKQRLLANLPEYLDGREFDYDFPVRNGETSIEILSSLREDYKNTVESTMDYMKTEQLKLAALAMHRAKQIDIYSSAGNVFFAENFAFQMQEIGVSVQVPVDEYHQQLLAAASDMSHMAILITFEGRGKIVKNISMILKQNKVPTLLICSPNLKGIDGNYTLYFSPHEHHSDKVSSFSTRLSLLFILDALYASYFGMDYDGNLRKRREFYQKMTGG